MQTATKTTTTAGGPGVAGFEDAEDSGTPRGIVERLRSLPAIPLAFLGLGMLRGWLSVLFENGLTAGAGFHMQQNVFDALLVCFYLACILGARRVTPLFARPWARWAGGALLVGASLLGIAFAAAPQLALPLGVAYTLAAAAGTVLVTLMWMELYGMASPVRACLYYAGSVAVGSGVGWLYQGFLPAWLPVAAALLPLISLRCLANAHASGQVPPIGQQPGWADFTFPWRPVLVVALYSIAYGLMQATVSPVFKQVTSPGTTCCALVVAGVIYLLHDRLDFGRLYGVGLPVMTGVAFALAASGALSPWWTNFCANWGHVSSQMFIVTMMCSICYHWGVSAVWLFGIEDVVWTLAGIGGRMAERVLSAVGVSALAPVVALVAVATIVIVRQGRLSSAWGMLPETGSASERRADPARERASLTAACADISRAHALSQREEEVLLLLAQHKTARDIEHELCVANGTAKAHIRHVYQKLDIHTREELFAMVGAARER